MRDTIRIYIHGREQHLPRGMVGFHATVELAARLRMSPTGLTLCRAADQTYLGASVPVGDALSDGDELKFVPHPGVRTAA